MTPTWPCCSPAQALPLRPQGLCMVTFPFWNVHSFFPWIFSWLLPFIGSHLIVTSFPNHPVWSSHPITSLLFVLIFCTAFSLLILSFALFMSLHLVSTTRDVELVGTISCYMRNWSPYTAWTAVSVGFLELMPSRHWRMMGFASLSCHPRLLCTKNSAWKIVGDQ